MIKTESPWMLSLQRNRPLHRLTSDADTDIVIIGGGVSGMILAHALLTETDKRVILVEKNRLSSGASGHNAGQAVAAFEVPYSQLVETYGRELTDQTYAEVNNAFSSLEAITAYASFAMQEVEALASFHNLEAAKERLNTPGSTNLYVSDDNNETAIHLDNFKEKVWSSKYVAAVGYKAGIVNCPVLLEKLATRLLQEYEGRFNIYEETKAERIILNNDEATIECGRYTLHSDFVALCTNGYGDFELVADHPAAVNKSIQPVAGYMIGELEAPAPIGVRSYIPLDHTEPYYYVTRRDAGRESLTCTGGLDTRMKNWQDIETWTAEDERKCSQIESFLLRNLEGFSGPRDFQWKGLMAYTKTGVRLAGKDPQINSLYYSLGCNGIGILPAVVSAEIITKQIRGEEAPRTFFDPDLQRPSSTGNPEEIQLVSPPSRE